MTLSESVEIRSRLRICGGNFSLRVKSALTEVIIRIAVIDGRIKFKVGMMFFYRVMLMSDVFCFSIRFVKFIMTVAVLIGGVSFW